MGGFPPDQKSLMGLKSRFPASPPRAQGLAHGSVLLVSLIPVTSPPCTSPV